MSYPCWLCLGFPGDMFPALAVRDKKEVDWIVSRLGTHDEGLWYLREMSYGEKDAWCLFWARADGAATEEKPAACCRPGAASAGEENQLPRDRTG